MILNLPNSPSNEEKYSYIIKYPVLLKILYLVSAFSWIMVGYGYFQFFAINWIYYLTMAPILLFITTFNILSLTINMFYQKFDIFKHKYLVQSFWINSKNYYKINIFLPVCGEDLEVLRNTWEGVLNLSSIRYMMEVVVLDDQDNPSVKNLSREFGFRYMVRPNRGFMKKAGNLKYGFDNTDGNFIVILDADFRPRADFIIDTLPYMQDSKVGIVQTPQFFDQHNSLHNYSPLQAGAGNIQEYFYKIIQNSRDSFGGAICVGSCAIYRRQALMDVGGTAQVEHSEDVHTGFSLINMGWKIKYLPLVLSKGVCPDDFHAFFKQQTRWCSGSMSMMVNRSFWLSKIPIMTRLCYISGFMYYISNPLSLILVFQSFILLWFHSNNLSFFNLFIFVPFLMCSGLLQFFYVYSKVKYGTILAHSCAFWFYCFTLITMIAGHVEGWKPTGIKSDLSKGFVGIYRFVTIYVLIYLVWLLLLLRFNKIVLTNYLIFPFIFWIVINIIYHLYFWFNIHQYVKVNHRSRLKYHSVRKFVSKFIIILLLLLIFTTATGQFLRLV